MRKILGIAAVVAAIGAAAFWAAQPGQTRSDADYLFAHLQARSGAQDAVWLESSFAEMLPSRQFSVNGSLATAGNKNGVVIGSVVAVNPGRGYAHPDDAPKGVEVAFDAADALWRTVDVTVAVEESWGRVAGLSKVTFAVIIDRGADADTAVDGLRSLGKVIVALDRQGRFDYAPDVYSIGHSGDLFGTVDAAGGIKLNAMEDEGAEFLAGVDTMAELRTEAVKTPTVVAVDVVDGVFTRV
ncbi:hypothetical protein AB0M47_12260 [Hamadaea sp. NPDC051192]|uniref:hypothetical protein n=1 Tax=Hamadaea sp. NPDC051192 TaxID=3154940 RepID=UPI003429285C